MNQLSTFPARHKRKVIEKKRINSKKQNYQKRPRYKLTTTARNLLNTLLKRNQLEVKKAVGLT